MADPLDHIPSVKLLPDLERTLTDVCSHISGLSSSTTYGSRADAQRLRVVADNMQQALRLIQDSVSKLAKELSS